MEVLGGFETVDETTVDTAYDCCVAAILDNGGDTSVFAFEPGAAAGAINCFIGVTDDTCPNPATNPSTVQTDPSGDLVIGNAYCGEIDVAIPEIAPSEPVKRSLPTAIA